MKPTDAEKDYTELQAQLHTAKNRGIRAEADYEKARNHATNLTRRVRALEQAIKRHPNITCEVCTGAKDCAEHGKATACTLAGWCPDAWEFDEVRFGEDGRK